MKFMPSLVLRYLMSRRGFTRVVTGFSVLGITLGVAALIVVMCVMAGFREELLSRILGMTGHMTVRTYVMDTDGVNGLATKIKELDGVSEAKGVIQGQLMVSVSGKSSGGVVRAMNVDAFPKLIKDNILQGDLDLLKQPQTVAIGEGMARSLGVSVGDVITLLSPDGARTMFGFVPRIVQTKVGAVFDTGMQGYDNGFIMMDVPLAQSLFKLGDTLTALEVRVENPATAKDFVEPIYTIGGPGTQVMSWEESNRQFFQALQVERGDDVCYPFPDYFGGGIQYCNGPNYVGDG